MGGLRYLPSRGMDAERSDVSFAGMYRPSHMTVTRDGKYLLNVRPTADGILEDRMQERLNQIGEWLEQYGQSIYGTRGGPFPPGSGEDRSTGTMWCISISSSGMRIR